TKELNCELEKRKGVKVFRVKPYQRYKITIDDKFIDDIGPVIITLNID
ncbi:MAG: BC1881 family protein, partial [Elusimicrobiota bacterium]|nr:BC1881 family protein [Elusimicrobiota bacterium]